MKKKRTKVIWIIEQYASTPTTGIAGRHYNFATEWAKSGHSVYVIASGVHHLLKERPSLTGSITEEKINGFSFIWLKLPRYKHAHDKKRVLGWFLFSLKILTLSQKIKKPDVIFYSSPAPFGIVSSYLIARKYKAKLIFEVRDIWPLTLVELGGYCVKHPFIKLMQWTEDFAYKNSDMVISNLKYSAQHMVSRGMDEYKFHWIPNGFSLTEVEKVDKLDEAILAKLPSDKFIVGYAGTLGFANNLETLLEAAYHLKNDSKIYFAILGDGNCKKELEEKAKALELDNVLFLGKQPKSQVQSFLAKLSVCFIGLKKDRLFRFGVSPNKLFDYFYAAKPIIYAIDSGAYKPIHDAGAGLQIEPENPFALVEAIKKMYGLMPKERETMGNNGKQYAMENHEYRNLSSKLLSIIME